MKYIWLGILLICVTPVQAQKTDTLTNSAIIEMIEFGFDESIVISKIRTGIAKFDTSIDSLKKLKSKGVSNAIIAEMIKSANNDQETNESKENAPSVSSDFFQGITKKESIYRTGGLSNKFEILAHKKQIPDHGYIYDISVMARDARYTSIIEYEYVIIGSPQEVYDVFKQIRDGVNLLGKDESINIKGNAEYPTLIMSMERLMGVRYISLYSNGVLFNLPPKYAQTSCDKIAEYCKENNIELIE